MNRNFIALLLLSASAAVAFARVYSAPVWVLLLPCAVWPWRRIERVPPAMVRTARIAGNMACATTFLLGVALAVLPIMVDYRPRVLPLVLGYVLAALCALFLLGLQVWPAATGVIPAALSLLVIACWRPGVDLRVLLAAAGAGLFAYLAPEGGWRAGGTARVRRLALYATLSVITAWVGFRGLWALQDVFERGLFDLFSQIASTSGGSSESELGSLEELKLSRKVVLRVWSERPQKLRVRVYPWFDGRTWRGGKAERRPPPGPELPPPGARVVSASRGEFALSQQEANPVSTRIVGRISSNAIPAPTGVVAVQAQVPSLRVDAYSIPWWGDATAVPDRYTVLHRRDGRVVQREEEGDSPCALCLEMPANVDPRVRDLAQRLAAGAPDARTRVRRTLEYLGAGYTYTLKPGKFRTADPVAEFLFEKKQGYCEYFATAAVMLLRLEGVPARYVTGYNVQMGNHKLDHFVVREKDAHAWIEVYLPGGWVEADPTPAAEYEAMVADASGNWFRRAAEDAWEWVQVWASEWWSRLRAGDWRGLWQSMRGWLGIGVLAAGAIWGLRRLWRRWRRQRPIMVSPAVSTSFVAIAPEVAELMATLDRRWAELGFTRPAYRAPREYAASLPDTLSAPLRAAGLRVVDCFYRVRFAREAASAAELSELRAALQSIPPPA